jgi:hypothetical protein
MAVLTTTRILLAAAGAGLALLSGCAFYPVTDASGSTYYVPGAYGSPAYYSPYYYPYAPGYYPYPYWGPSVYLGFSGGWGGGYRGGWRGGSGGGHSGRR